MSHTVAANLLWFQNSLVTIHVSTSDGQDGISILEHFAPYGFSPPLHLHRTEDEVFYALEGEFRVRLRDQEHRFGPGAVLLAPKGVPHTYRIESAPAGRFLTTTVRGDFERFVRAVSRPAQRPELPRRQDRHQPTPSRRSESPPPNMALSSSVPRSNDANL